MELRAARMDSSSKVLAPTVGDLLMDLHIVKLTVCLFYGLTAFYGNKMNLPKRVIWAVCVGKLKEMTTHKIIIG